MSSFAVVVNFNVLKNFSIGFLKIGKSAFFQQFGFETAKEALCHRIVVMVVFAGHAGEKIMGCQELSKAMSGILPTAMFPAKDLTKKNINAAAVNAENPLNK